MTGSNQSCPATLSLFSASYVRSIPGRDTKREASDAIHKYFDFYANGPQNLGRSTTTRRKFSRCCEELSSLTFELDHETEEGRERNIRLLERMLDSIAKWYERYPYTVLRGEGQEETELLNALLLGHEPGGYPKVILSVGNKKLEMQLPSR